MATWLCVDLPINQDGTFGTCNGWRIYDLDVMQSQIDAHTQRLDNFERTLSTSQYSSVDQTVLQGFEARIQHLESLSSTSSGFLPEITQAQASELSLAIIGVLVLAWGYRIISRFIMRM